MLALHLLCSQKEYGDPRLCQLSQGLMQVTSKLVTHYPREVDHGWTVPRPILRSAVSECNRQRRCGNGRDAPRGAAGIRRRTGCHFDRRRGGLGLRVGDPASHEDRAHQKPAQIRLVRPGS
jgi:hypothetical protein